MADFNPALQSHPQPQPILQMSNHSFPPGAPLNGDTASKAPEPAIAYSWRELHPNAQFFYLRDHTQANDIMQRLPPGPYGLDLEWKPIFRKGEQANPVALVQIANHQVVILLQLTAMKMFPIKLHDFLANPVFVKAGVGIQGDAKKLYQDWKANTRGCVDLALLARTVDNALWKGKYDAPIGLARLVATYKDRALAKGKITRSNWERNLSEAQQLYAANDAHAGYVIYMRLMDMIPSLSYTPVASYYTFNTVTGRLCDPSGATWFAHNPYYDPGPPPPPRAPKPPKKPKTNPANATTTSDAQGTTPPVHGQPLVPQHAGMLSIAGPSHLHDHSNNVHPSSLIAPPHSDAANPHHRFHNLYIPRIDDHDQTRRPPAQFGARGSNPHGPSRRSKPRGRDTNRNDHLLNHRSTSV